MSENQNVPIEIENENDNEETIEVKALQPEPVKETPQKQSIPRKPINDLTQDERKQLIEDAKNGIENEHYNVKFFKNGNTHITLKKQTKAQELIRLNEANPEKVSLPTTRYLTNEQLLLEHVLNLESQYNKLHAKHKKLKKRYNDLEGYLYADDSDDEKPSKQAQQSQLPPLQQEVQQPQPVPQQIQPQQTQYVQRRFVRSWRDIRPPQ